MGRGIYIHIPFCSAKCGYCDFLSFDNKQNEWTVYKDALINELSLLEEPADTIYIGGGTPTVWPAPFLSELLQALPPATIDAEITCEANPGTLTAEKISVLTAGGVNRISLGLQAWQPHLLKAIGRQSCQKIFLESYHALRHAGINNINIDIMFALLGQRLADWEETLKEVTALEPEHISAYALTPDAVDEETDRLMYHRCKAFLRERGYMQYELSNFCKPGFESKHNLRYWTLKPYTGFGLGAHSFDGKSRWHNTTDMKKYLSLNNIYSESKTSTKISSEVFDSEQPPVAQKVNSFLRLSITEDMTEADAMAEFMFLGLRMTKGVSANAFIEKFGQHPHEIYAHWITKMKKDGLLQEKNDHIFLTDFGMDLANLVMAGFLE